MNHFDEQLIDGHSGEMRVKIAFVRAGCAVEPYNNDGRMDLAVRVHNEPFFIEVKNEDKQQHTGNLCIELLQGKTGEPRPSGLSVSESTVCVHTLGEQAAAYRTQYLRLFLKQRKYPRFDFGRADNGNSGVLVPIQDVINNWWFVHCPITELPASKIFTPAGIPNG